MEKQIKFDYSYELKAICLHSGSSTDNGHYTSNLTFLIIIKLIIKIFKSYYEALAWSSKNSKWKYFDDSKCTLISDEQEFLLKMSKVCQPYILFYSKCTKNHCKKIFNF